MKFLGGRPNVGWGQAGFELGKWKDGESSRSPICDSRINLPSEQPQLVINLVGLSVIDLSSTQHRRSQLNLLVPTFQPHRLTVITPLFDYGNQASTSEET